jgi:hypothetical protein
MFGFGKDNLNKNPKMGKTDRLSQLMMFYSLEAEQKELK